MKAYPGASLIGMDVNPDAVEFCHAALGVEAFQSHEDPRQVVIRWHLDLIWCASVVTHVDQDRWPCSSNCLNRTSRLAAFRLHDWR